MRRAAARIFLLPVFACASRGAASEPAVSRLLLWAPEAPGAEVAAVVSGFETAARERSIPVERVAAYGGATLAKIVKVSPDGARVLVFSPEGEMPLAATVEADDAEGGRLAARYLIGSVDDSGDVASIEDVATNPERGLGFREIVGRHPAVKLVGSRFTDGSAEGAARAAASLLAEQPEIEGIFCVTDRMAVGAIRAIEKAGRAGKVAVVGYGNTEEARPFLESGALAATVETWPEWRGAEAVRAAMKRGGPRQRRGPVELVSSRSLQRADAPPPVGPGERRARAAAARIFAP